MPFPTEFPADAAKAIGNAILTRTFDRTLLEPAYDLQGFAEYMIVGSDAPFPKPVVSAGPGDDDAIARALLVAAEGEGDEHSVRALPIPWGQVISLLLSLIQGVLVSEATK